MPIETTAHIQGRVRHEDVAALALFCHQQGWNVESKSELVRIAFELAVRALTMQGLVERPTSLESALAILDTLGIDGLARKGRKLASLTSALQVESLARDFSQRSSHREIDSQLRTAHLENLEVDPSLLSEIDSSKVADISSETLEQLRKTLLKGEDDE